MEVSALQKVNVHSTEKSFIASVKPDMSQTDKWNKCEGEFYRKTSKQQQQVRD